MTSPGLNGHAQSSAPGGRLPEGESPGAIEREQVRGAFAELRRQRDQAQERCVELMAEVARLRIEVAMRGTDVERLRDELAAAKPAAPPPPPDASDSAER